MTQRFRSADRLWFPILLLYAAGGWAAFELFVPSLVQALYEGRGPAALTRLLESRDTIPLATYQARGRTLFFGLHTFVVWIGLLVLLQARYRLIERPKLELRPTTEIRRAPSTLVAMKVAVGLCALWGAAFLLAPLWMTVTPSLWLPALLVVGGVIWAMRASADVTLAWSPLHWPSVATLLLVMGLASPGALTAPIAWRGDEGYHVAVVLTIVQNPFWLAAMAVAIAAWRWGAFSSRAAGWRLLFVVAVTFLLVGRTYGDQVAAAARYPFASRWLQALPVQPFVVSSSLIRQEALFRLVPFVSAAFLAMLALSRLRETRAVAWLAGVAIATTPIVLYYSSILYLEMPAVLLATIVSLSIREIVERDSIALRKAPAWYALLTLAFLKETMLPFLLAVIVVRGGYQLWARRSFIKEIEIAALVLVPLVLYLLFRTAGAAPREYGFDLGQMLSSEPYGHFVSSWRDQAPVLATLFLVLSVALLAVGEWLMVGFAWLAVAATAAFFAGDVAAYAGYSRFNLLALPLFLAVVLTSLQKLARWQPRLAAAVAVVWLATNAVGVPVHSDGSRIPQWGSRAADTADYTYPYPEALRWLRDHYRDARVFATGLDYPYSYDFYFRRLNWQPPFHLRLIPAAPVQSAREIEGFFTEALQQDATVVLYHVRREDLRPETKLKLRTTSVSTSGSAADIEFEAERTFINRAGHELIVFRRGS